MRFEERKYLAKGVGIGFSGKRKPRACWLQQVVEKVRREFVHCGYSGGTMKNMRGTAQAQPKFWSAIKLNATVPAGHPLRAIKRQVGRGLKKLSPLFDDLYQQNGRPSILPEQRIKTAC